MRAEDLKNPKFRKRFKPFYKRGEDGSIWLAGFERKNPKGGRSRRQERFLLKQPQLAISPETTRRKTPARVLRAARMELTA